MKSFPLSCNQTASNAKEARHYIDTISPDVVFMDIQMQRIRTALLKSIRKETFTLCLPNISRVCCEALRQRAFDYLLKPIDKDELQACSRKF